MMHKTLLAMTLIAVLLLAACTTTIDEQAQQQPADEQAQKTYKVLHVMSYHSPWEWTDMQLQGFKDGLGTDLDVEYQVYQLDGKQHSDPESLEAAGQKARTAIDEWQPDLVYTNDDLAQTYITKHYLNTTTPLVFSGVNSAPSTYGFDASTNVAGVLESEHSAQTIKLLREIDPSIQTIAVITDDSETMAAVMQRLKDAQASFEGVTITRWDVAKTYAEYQQRILEYQDSVDAILLLGVFTFKGDDGQNVPFEEVLQWTAENSMLPDGSFWSDRVSKGTLASATVSAYEQGLAAGKMARQVLVEGAEPSSLGFITTVKGEPVISLARANKLGLSIKSDLLLSATIVETFPWSD